MRVLEHQIFLEEIREPSGEAGSVGMSSISYAGLDLTKSVSGSWKIRPELPTGDMLALLWSQCPGKTGFWVMASVMCIKVREALSLWVSIIFLSAFHWPLLPLQTQLWLKMQFLIFHPVSLLLTRFSTTMTFSFFSLQILLFMISFLPPYFGYHFLVIMELRGKTSKDTVWKLQHLYHFSMSSENQDIFRKDNEFGAIELIPCNISTLRVRSLAFT